MTTPCQDCGLGAELPEKCERCGLMVCRACALHHWILPKKLRGPRGRHTNPRARGTNPRAGGPR